MGGSGAETPTPSQPLPAIADGFRASDAEREQVAARLRDEFVAGRLSHDTFLLRMNAVLEARQQSELPLLLADLPPSPPPGGPLSAARMLLRRARRTWSARRELDGAQHGMHPGSPETRQAPQRSARQGQRSPEGSAPSGGSSQKEGWPSAPRGRGVTIGMQVAPGPNRPFSLRFPRGDGDEYTIGRDGSCDFAIADMTVSRWHATLKRTADGWLLTDLASTNGTRVNGWRVRGRVAVRAGDLVTFGDTQAVLLCDEE